MAKPLSGTRHLALLVLLICTGGSAVVCGQEVGSPWITSQLSGGPGQLPGRFKDERVMAIRPEVHSVKSDGHLIEVRSAGISLYYFGPLQAPDEQVERVRRFRFRIPARPVLPDSNDGQPVRVRPEVVGLFVNGVPIRDLHSRQSYRGQNIWHFDQLAINDDGLLVAAGRPQAAPTHSTPPGLLGPLIAGRGIHSPIIGFAFDGYPIYGPWGYVNPDGRGGLRRMRSGYRLRQITTRDTLPDGTRLTPGQGGPDVDAQYPLGSFVEDYHYAPGAGDLDRFNGRWTVTPEYPQGTYAYFLTIDEVGRLAFPYLLGSHYRGRITHSQLAEACLDEAGLPDRPPDWEISRQPERMIPALTIQEGYQLSLRVSGGEPVAGRPLRLSFAAQNPLGETIRALEHVHEKPLHLLVVSEDLTEFEHLHPELVAGDRYEVVHQFGESRRYRLYADYTPPGGAPQIVAFLLEIAGKGGRSRPRERLTRAGPSAQSMGELRLRLAPQGQLRAGEEIDFRLRIRDRTGGLPAGLEPFLGAWAHFVVIDPAHRHFIHAHPVAEGTAPPAEIPGHLHLAADPGPAPQEVRTMIIFPQPGLYRIWAQFQVAGRLITAPFDVKVEGAVAEPRQPTPTHRPGTILVRVGRQGFLPAEIQVPGGVPIRLAIERLVEPNCASQIVFPALGLRRQLPLGETTTIELPPTSGGALRFSCGMGMYRGAIIATSPEAPRKAK
ncbi:MAG: hypothetical protein RIR86_2240 [Acidobacteriota bacterium]